MRFSWNKTRAKFKITTGFSDYFKYVGIPFEDILKKIGINKNIKKIKKFYNYVSSKYTNCLKLYPGVKLLFSLMKKKNIPYYIVTSKNFTRTNLFIKFFLLNPKSIHCPKKNLRGKPYPDQLLECINKNRLKKKNTCYVGDTFFDYKASKAAGIDFIFANYGFEKKKNSM